MNPQSMNELKLRLDAASELFFKENDKQLRSRIAGVLLAGAVIVTGSKNDSSVVPTVFDRSRDLGLVLNDDTYLVWMDPEMLAIEFSQDDDMAVSVLLKLYCEGAEVPFVSAELNFSLSAGFSFGEIRALGSAEDNSES